MSYSRLVVEADGASRGNPGAAAGGAVVLDPETGQVVAKAGVLCGHASNNVAEYRGMIEGLDIALAMAPEGSVHVRMDSKLVVEQMSGRWKIKHPDMQDLARAARELIGSRSVTFEWVPREENSRADAAANAALDRGETYREH
ncbi:MAG: reverse transcriptase-like protein [Pontimonas sp.]|nr:reverse transcriptase-like protein [Pontimonas sp.]